MFLVSWLQVERVLSDPKVMQKLVSDTPGLADDAIAQGEDFCTNYSTTSRCNNFIMQKLGKPCVMIYFVICMYVSYFVAILQEPEALFMMTDHKYVNR